MRETRADTAQAVMFALLLHAFLFALLFFGLRWTRNPESLSAAGSPVSAEITDASALSAAMRRTLAQKPEPPPPEPVREQVAPPPQPVPEPRPQEEVVPPQPLAQEPVPEPAPIEQEKVDRNALAAEAREREQEEKHRQEQIDLTERKRQEESEKKYRLAQQQLDEKIQKIQKQREQAAREADLAEQKLKQIADAQTRNVAQAVSNNSANTNPPVGNNGVDAGLRARYIAALQAAIVQNWTRPDTVPLGQICKIEIRQLPGGEVIDAKVDPSCPYDELGRRSIEAAVLKAQPLPFAGFEPVFNRTLLLNFQAQDQ